MRIWTAFILIIIILFLSGLGFDKVVNKPEYEQQVLFNKHIEDIEGKEFIVTIDGKEHKVTVKQGDVVE